jgi:hypothetical protein
MQHSASATRRPAVARVVRRPRVAAADDLEQRVDQTRVPVEVDARRRAGDHAVQAREVLAAADLVGVVAVEDDRVGRPGSRNVARVTWASDSTTPTSRRRRGGRSRRAGSRCRARRCRRHRLSQRAAGLAHPGHRLAELLVDLGRGVAEVQVVVMASGRPPVHATLRAALGDAPSPPRAGRGSSGRPFAVDLERDGAVGPRSAPRPRRRPGRRRVGAPSSRTGGTPTACSRSSATASSSPSAHSGSASSGRSGTAATSCSRRRRTASLSRASGVYVGSR